MNDFLTNDEIDALLQLFATEGVPEELGGGLDTLSGGIRKDEVAPLDLLKPNRFTRDNLMVIERIQEMVARKLGGTISDRLRLDVSCDCVAVEQLRFSAWMGQVESPTGVYVVDMKPLKFPAVVTISSRLLYGIVDRVLGGSGRMQHGTSDLSEAEYAVADSLIVPLVDRLAEGVGEIVPVEASIAGRYTNIAMAQALPLHEVVLAVHFQVSGQPLMGDIRLVLPYSALESWLDRLSKSRFVSTASHAGEFRNVLGDTVQSVPMELGVRLGRSEIGLGELLSLDVGDVLPLPTKPGDLLDVPVQGRSKFRAHLGTRGNRYAVSIAELVTEPGREE